MKRAYHTGGHGFLLLVRCHNTRILGPQPLPQRFVVLHDWFVKGQRRVCSSGRWHRRGGASLRGGAAEAGAMSSSVKKWLCGWKKGQRTEVTELSPTR